MFLDNLSNVENAADTDSAIKLLETKTFDLILMDISFKYSINGLGLTLLI